MRRDENLEAEIARIVQSVNEWDDRTSPDDYPEHLLITSEELADILRNLAEAALVAPTEAAWQPIETAPGMTDVLVWWPLVQLDDDGEPTDEVTGGAAFVSELQRDYWIEPDALNAMGDHMGDDETYAAQPSHWMPLPAAPGTKGGDHA